MSPSHDGGLVTFQKYVTERKRAEEQLRKSEERWRAVFENSAVGIAMLHPGGRFLAANAAYQDMLGYSEVELQALSWMDVTHEDDRAANWGLVTELLEKQRQSFILVKRNRHKDGRVIWVNVHASLVPGTEGIPGFIMAIVEDITKRKHSEQRLAVQYAITCVLAESDTLVAATPHLLQAIGECMEWEWGALWNVDRDAGVLHCESIWHTPNLEVAEFDAISRATAGLPSGSLKGHVWQHAEPAWIADIMQDSNFMRAPIAARVGLCGAIAFPILVHGGTVGVMEFFNRAVWQPDEEQLATLAAIGSQIGQFIEHKRAEETLHKAQEELAHVTRVLTLGALTTSIAHEVNQPLTAVINNGNACLRWLGRVTPDLEAVRGALRDIITNGQRAGDVIARLRAALKKAPTHAVRLDLNQVIAETVWLTHHEMQRHEVRLRTDLAADLPPVLGDHIQLQQVLLNLVLNGIEAMSTVIDWPRELLIRSGHTGSNGVLVAVQDAGIGLDPQTLERIFDAFFTTKPAGLGMGLAISRTIIQAHGGQLWAERNPGHGATLQFVLPQAGEENKDD